MAETLKSAGWKVRVTRMRALQLLQRPHCFWCIMMTNEKEGSPLCSRSLVGTIWRITFQYTELDNPTYLPK